MVKNANTLLETKYKVVQSVVEYGENKMDLFRDSLGKYIIKSNILFYEDKTNHISCMIRTITRYSVYSYQPV